MYKHKVFRQPVGFALERGPEPRSSCRDKCPRELGPASASDYALVWRLDRLSIPEMSACLRQHIYKFTHVPNETASSLLAAQCLQTTMPHSHDNFCRIGNPTPKLISTHIAIMRMGKHAFHRKEPSKVRFCSKLFSSARLAQGNLLASETMETVSSTPKKQALCLTRRSKPTSRYTKALLCGVRGRPL